MDISKHHFSKGSVHFSDEDMEFMHSVLRAPIEKAEPEDDSYIVPNDGEEQWHPDFEGDDEVEDDAATPRRARRRNQGEEPVSRAELLAVVGSITELIRTMQNAPAPSVTVNPVVSVELKPTKEVKTVHRDAQNRISSIESEIK